MIHRKHTFFIVIIGILLVLPVVMVMTRYFLRDKDFYMWHDAPGRNIELPDGVRGPFGFNACLSPNKNQIFVVGNEVMLQESIEEKIDPVFMMMALRFSFYVADVPEYKNFKHIYRHDNPGIVYDMACSPASPNLIAFIAGTTQLTLPNTHEELHAATDNVEINKRTQNEFQQANKDGSWAALFLLDVSTGSVQELTRIHDKIPLRNIFLYKGARFLCWAPDGQTIFYNDSDFIWSIQIDSGEKQQFYPISGGAVFSNMHCDPNGVLRFILCTPLEGSQKIPGTNVYRPQDMKTRFVQIDSSGHLLSENKASFYPGTYEFEDTVFALIGNNRVTCIKMDPGVQRNSVLNVFSIDDIVNDDTGVYPLMRRLLHDRNRIQFYYQPLAFNADEKELYLVKKRAVRGDHRTPININNAYAQWIEFRKLTLE